MNANNYVAVCNILFEKVSFSEASPVGSPAGSPFDAAALAEVVKTNQGLLPATYRSSYASLLLNELPHVTAQLRQLEQQLRTQGESPADALAEVKSYADTLVGAVRDWGQEAYRGPLRRFEAVVSNLYRSFLSDEQRASVALPLVETVPPLVTFAPTADAGPFTLPSDGVKQFTGSTVGVVSLPGSYAAHPLIWPALAHETGGHDVLHADPGLIEELAEAAKNLPGLPDGLGAVWGAWMDETAADVYGLLNVGPAFAPSLAAFFSALEKSSSSSHVLGTISTVLPVASNQLVDVHPVDLLRLYVALGVVESLEGLAFPKRQAWLTQIQAIATTAAGGKNTIDVVDVEKRAVVQQLPLPLMADAAKKIGIMIATAKLDALQGHSIQEIETWDDADESAAANIALLAASSSIVGLGDDAQLLAGATSALFDNPAKYAEITATLNAALDDSYARDPIFGTGSAPVSRGRKRRVRRSSRTAPPPRFPISLT